MSAFVPLNASIHSSPPSPRSEYAGRPEYVENSIEENPSEDLTAALEDQSANHQLASPRQVSPTDFIYAPKLAPAVAGTSRLTPEPSDNEDNIMGDTTEEDTTVDTSLGDTTLDTSLEDYSLSDDQPDTVMTLDEPRGIREFECVYNPKSPCNTGQFSMHLARKTISDHFGRNKACTRLITGWPLFCRKHYQRCTYHRHNWQLHKIDLIKTMFRTIDRQFPGIEYTVQMKKSEENRINEYAREQAFASKNKEPVFEAPPAIPAKGKSFEAPMSLLVKLMDRMGKDRSMRFCRATMNIIKEEVEADKSGRLELPSIEFLPQIPKLKSPRKSRVSKSGAIQKTK